MGAEPGATAKAVAAAKAKAIAEEAAKAKAIAEEAARIAVARHKALGERDVRVRDFAVATDLDQAEAADLLRRQAKPASEIGPRSGKRLATGYINTTHPETGLDVVFTPGEALPEWVLEGIGTEQSA
ncbi:hypothetical protein [Agromyces badenianii]|uniref:hypothetical protein n=1 Tax=Agromyces badenianii TaxID=2080742 RepID=UPI000D59559B|nr:hypothetical protein [Agromyces badenianii]PWC04262.1 hypothetical protein DCE94_08900 [Agromyces badenianii]